MAHLHTLKPEDRPGRHGEFVVAKWLSEVSNSGLHLWFNVNYLRGVGELDAIIAHPNIGFVVIEVKGFSLREVTAYLPNGFIEYGNYRRKNPALQGQEQAQKLKSWFRDCRLNVKTPWVHSVAWWPNINRHDWIARFGSDSEAAADAKKMLFREDLDSFDEFAKRVRTICEEPRFGIVPPRNALEIETTVFEIFIGELTKQSVAERPVGNKQVASSSPVGQAFNSKYSLPEHWDEKNLFIQGPVGSGKTATLLRVGFEHLKQGRRVLFSCYNKTLAAELRRHIGLLDQVSPHAEFLALDFFELAKFLQPEIRANSFDTYLGQVAKTTAIEQKSPFDVILIDEAQDMSEHHWELLRSVSSKTTYTAVAYGRNQEIYASSPCPSLEKFRIKARKSNLKRRFRNSAQAYFVSQAFYAYMLAGSRPETLESIILDATTRQSGVDGTGEVKQATFDFGDSDGAAVISVNQAPNVSGDVRGLVKLMLKHARKEPVNSLILVNDKKSDAYGEALATLTELDLPFHDVVDDRNRRTSAPRSSIRISTVHSARGLEADYVLVCDFDRICGWKSSENPAIGRNLAYIALTRARKNTLVSKTGSASGYFDSLEKIISEHEHPII